MLDYDRQLEYLRASANCLTSIYTNPIEGGFEIWVIDNASTDGTAGMVRSRLHRVKLIEKNVNMGFA